MNTAIRQKIQLGNREVAYDLIRSKRAKNLSLKINPQSGLEVVLPPRYSLSGVPRFIHEKEEWVLRNLKELRAKKARAPKLKDGVEITVFGKARTVHIFPTNRKNPTIKEARTLQFGTQTAYYDGVEILIHANTMPAAKKVLEQYLRALAKKHFQARVAHFADQIGVKYRRITIKGQKSRWGSCSRAKNLNFNWRLALAPLRVSDSVIIHELSHLIHLDHSARFYRLVEEHCPGHEKYSQYLREFQPII